MKRLFLNLLFSFGFCIYGNMAFSQSSSAFYDAVKLSDAVESNNETQFYKVVATYTGLPYRSEIDKKAIDAKLQQAGNTVLLEYTELFRQRQLSGRTITTASMGRGNAIPGAAVATGGGGSGVGSAGLAEGVSRFIVDRVKQEVLLAFFERFYKDFMQKPELQMLFPATYNYMTVFEGQGKEVGLMIDVLRNAFKKDMNNIPNTFMRVAQAEKYQNYINERPALKTTIATAAGIGYLIDNRDHPAVVIDKLTRLDFIKNSPSDELTRAINSLAFVSNALKDSLNSPNSWITQEQLQFLETVPSGPALFMGLNLQRYGHLINQLNINPKDLPIKYQTHLYWNNLNAQNNTVKMKDVLGSYRLNYYTSNYVPLNDSISNAAYNIFRPYFNDFLTLTADIDEQLGQLKNKRRNGQSFDVDEFMGYVNLFTDMVSIGLKSATFGAPSSQNTLLRITPSLLDMRRSIQKQDYTAAIIDLNVLLLSALPQSTGIKDDILRYSMFIANVASAQNSQELHWALETAALPTGSARVKRESVINISLNAYTGPFFGGENLLDTPAQNDWGSLVALAAPIGIAFSTGLSGAGSVTLLTSFIDVGALVSYRFGDSKAGALPEISFKNMVAPGLYMIYGFPKTPISVGAGVQYGPQIRKVTINNAEVNTSAYRIGVFAGIDIPVLNFYNKPR
ncbi:MAG TPA: hypothetical protein PK239_16310 [Chitinophagales bacterium]|nr:hypothetical protein [Chitinophagales bacterium]HRK28839.1 hypothetical protein [Chitinophagales bacterium]